MSKYRSDLLYFLKLYDVFINGDEIRWVEKHENGAEFIVLLLRLMLIAKNRNGKLARIVGKMENPYTIEEIATETFQTEEIVRKGLEVLEKAELVVKEDGCYTIPKALEFTNQTTVGAVYMQDYRARKKESYICNTECNDKCNTDIEIEKEIRNKNKEKEIYTEEEYLLYGEIIEYLNNVTGSNYKVDSKNIMNLINQHMKEGYNKEDFISVIDKKYKEWKGTEREKYVRPETLFGDKFESYVNQKENKSTFDNRDWDSFYSNYKSR